MNINPGFNNYEFQALKFNIQVEITYQTHQISCKYSLRSFIRTYSVSYLGGRLFNSELTVL